jgi:hypothetical protein
LTITAPKRPRETDNVLLRVPTALRELAAKEASDQNMSQNAFITNSLLFGILAFGERRYVGKPQNVTALIDEIDRSYNENDAVVGAFHSQDWLEVESIVRMLESCDFLTHLKVRPDSQAANTTVFSFVLSRNGRASWTSLRSVLLMLASPSKETAPMA